MLALRLGLRLAARRFQSPRALIAGLLTLGVVLLCAWAERRTGLVGAPDRALSRVTFGAALPLFACFVLHLACSTRRLEEAVSVLALMGLNRRSATLGLLGGGALLCTLMGAVLGDATVLVARPLTDPALAGDVLATTWIGALAGLGYAGWFALGSTFGRDGRGRLWFLLVDWLFGVSSAAVLLPSPRACVSGLLGVVPGPGTSLMLCAALLGGLALACSLLATWRSAP
ncbi:MAG TPA: hypothetical protein VK524_01315 [Polyangiaceae bacterium]|nr:hypothetical protein [Polyangiaceae bacterium]